MLVVTGNQIFLTRGDTLILTLALSNSDGSEYVPAEGDSIFFRLKKFATYPNLLIEKEIDTSTMILQLNEADTAGLAFGDYHYEIEVVTAGGMHDTVIADELFTIGKEIENHA
jgi:hypothetical protein